MRRAPRPQFRSSTRSVIKPMNTRPAVQRSRSRHDSGFKAIANATTTPAQRSGSVVIVQWPLAWAIIGVLLAVDVVWGSQIEFRISGGEIKAGVIVALLAIAVAYRRRNRGRAN